jgi:hypothetical protein
VDLSPLLAGSSSVDGGGRSVQEALFGEGTGGFLLSGGREALESMTAAGVDAQIIGEVGGDSVEIEAGEERLSLGLEEARAAWQSLAQVMEPGV